mgnify:CR=1 FL=1
MKTKGFTFVELLVVMSFIGIIAMIVVPNIAGLMKQVDENKYKSFLNDVYLATEAYIQKNSSTYTSLQNGGTEYVYLSQLVNSKLLKSTVVNPKKNETIEKELDYTIIVTKNEDSGYRYELVEEKLTMYKETILNGTDPIIKGDLVAVTIENDGTVKKANLKSKWYSYENKKWANAVILKDKTVTYSDNDIIPEENIESYFVWIPKYQYKLFDLGNYTSTISSKPTTSIAHTIEIIFGTGTTSDKNDGECTTPMTSGATGNCKVGDYMTHPAFLSLNTNGIWVGKFETTGSKNEITIKPNIASLRNQTVKIFFELSYNYNRNLDSHMMKNTEWGAVSYLSHSKYGINGEININNNSDYLTGYSATEEANQTNYPGTTGTTENITKPYNTETGYKASTTGNITGIYDMSGGSHEYMASYMSSQYGSSGFDETIIQNYDSKYFDIYLSNSTVTSYNNRILGDATGEIGPFYSFKDGDEKNRNHNSWYSDMSDFMSSSYPFIVRSGGYNNGVLAGILYFHLNDGTSNTGRGSRLVLD